MKKSITLIAAVLALSFTQAQAAPKEWDMDSWLAKHQKWAKDNGKKYAGDAKKMKVFKAADANNDGTLTQKELSTHWKNIKKNK